ncbi:ATP-binding protein [Sulfuriferula nivalis]|uniref:histidine kinase n=1 Tax=Sulfuriferula nivalis TaxID=2675298 RepID=A0A809RKJ9_9PROT|nr:ATP-binding protein [Sulfuriferula nivalis]BBP02096.1 hypothetical protein SFSGTM_28040 [Sulfuriferula nivalis]
MNTKDSNDVQLTARKGERRHKKNAATDHELAVQSRDKLITAREDLTQLREDAVHVREVDIHEAETKQVATDNHILLLQQVNERLVISTIEAQKLAEKLQVTQIHLENAKLAAEQANLAKSEFLSSMSHELRTPLNAVLGFAQLLEAGTPPPTATQASRLQQIIKAGWYLLDLINEILDLATIESGKLLLSLEPVSLDEILHESKTMIEPLAQHHGIQIKFAPCHPNWFVNADYTRLKQVLINLLSNAVKYNCEHGTVEVGCNASSPEHFRISIKDSGAGLSAEKMAQLFQPFNRLGQETGNEEGTGIGLVVSKRLAELMQGSIGVESVVGVGSEFWIELTRNVAPQLAAKTDIPMAAESPQLNNVQSRTLLYVEDNQANLMLVEQIVARHPHLNMLSASDGYLGITLAREHLPDVILMDINLPGMNGYEALAILRSDPATKHIPVIAISANAMRHDIDKGSNAGFFYYLTKPIKIDELMAVLNNALALAECESINPKPD